MSIFYMSIVTLGILFLCFVSTAICLICMPGKKVCERVTDITVRPLLERHVNKAITFGSVTILSVVLLIFIVLFLCGAQAESTRSTTKLLFHLSQQVDDVDRDSILRHVIELNEASCRDGRHIGEDYLRFAGTLPVDHHFRERLLALAGAHGVMKELPAAPTHEDSE